MRVVGFFILLGGFIFHKLFTRFKAETYARMNVWQYLTVQFFMLTMVSLPVKVLLRLLFRIKYVWVTPWFNI